MDFPLRYADYSKMNAVLAYKLSNRKEDPHVIGFFVDIHCLPVGFLTTGTQVEAFRRKYPNLNVRVEDGCLYMWLQVFSEFSREYMLRLAKSFQKHLKKLQILPIICEVPAR